MKLLSFIIAAFAALVSSHATAQILSDNESYSRFELSFVSQMQKTSASGFDITAEESPKGFAIGFIHGFKLNAPLLFFETGANATFTHLRDTQGDGIDYAETTGNYINVAIPANLSIKLQFTNRLQVIPFAGANLKFNLLAKEQVDAIGYNEDINFFDNDYGYDSNRFQFGLNIGAGVNLFKRLYVGYKFQPDLVKFTTLEVGDVDIDSKTSNHYITVGLNF
ncbi:MAG: PorT family protein [Bacteroidales bacterium]|nr:PorT family protein [Bacteroidales bacterium]